MWDRNWGDSWPTTWQTGQRQEGGCGKATALSGAYFVGDFVGTFYGLFTAQSEGYNLDLLILHVHTEVGIQLARGIWVAPEATALSI